jgi:hypothetical protein
MHLGNDWIVVSRTIAMFGYPVPCRRRFAIFS